MNSCEISEICKMTLSSLGILKGVHHRVLVHVGTELIALRWMREGNGGTRVFDAMYNIALVDEKWFFTKKQGMKSTVAMLSIASNTRVPPLSSRAQRGVGTVVPLAPIFHGKPLLGHDDGVVRGGVEHAATTMALSHP